jgi:hypothetical protein
MVAYREDGGGALQPNLREKKGKRFAAGAAAPTEFGPRKSPIGQ